MCVLVFAILKQIKVEEFRISLEKLTGFGQHMSAHVVPICIHLFICSGSLERLEISKILFVRL